MTHCREEGRAAHCLLWWTHDLMNSDDLQKKPCSVRTRNWWKHACMRVSVQVQPFEVSTSCCTALGRKCLTLTLPPYSFHSEGSARLHKESFVLQHMQWISSCTSTTADDGMMIEGKSSSWEAMQKPRDPHAKHFGQHGSAKEHHWKDSQQPSNPERDKEQSLMLKTTQP